MRRTLFGLFICSFSISFAQLGPVPTVPNNLEIAGIKLKLTPGAKVAIQKDVNALRASDKYFQVKLDRVNLYFPIMERILKEEGVPEDIKYLAVQESSLISDAVSTSNAVGYWQFKDFTAREVGLRVDGKIDERKNIVSATHGAAKYFKRNNFYFKNWIYSVSAYQAGAGGAKKYVDEKLYGSNKLTITSKSHWYVLRFIAHYIAFNEEIGDPHSEGLKLVEYQKGAGKSLHEIAKEFDLEEDDLKEYNKWLKHGKIPDDKEYTVIIPIQGKLPKQLEQDENPPLTRSIPTSEPVKYPDQIVSTITGKNRTIFIKINGIEAVMAGKDDDMTKLAMKAEMSTDQLMKYNDLDFTHQIVPGEIYYVRNKKNRSPIRYHVVQYNETLWKISQQYGIKLKKLIKKNRIEEGEMLKAGRLLWLFKKRPKNTPIEYHDVKKPVEPKPVEIDRIPQSESIETDSLIAKPGKLTMDSTEVDIAIDPSESTTKPYNSRKTHLVKPGETLWGISRQYNISVDNLINWNGLVTGTLSVGQKLFVRAQSGNGKTTIVETDTTQNDTLLEKEIQEKPKEIVEENESTEVPKVDAGHADLQEATYHEVQSGETLWGISREYDVSVDEIIEWNSLERGSLSVGQKLLVSTPTIEQKDTIPEVKLISEAQEKSNKTEIQESLKEPNTHTVEPGESLWAISKKYDLDINDLLLWNGLSQGESLQVGQKLQITPNEEPQTPTSNYEVYTVKGGDSLFKIATTYGMTVDELIKINALSNTSLSVSQELKVIKR